LVADVKDAVGVFARHVLNAVGRRHGQSQQHRSRRQPISLLTGGQAADGHTQEAGQQDGVGEESQEEHVRWKPANAGQLQE